MTNSNTKNADMINPENNDYSSPNSDFKTNSSENGLIIEHHLDTQGLICPEPVMLLHRTIRKAEGGEYIEVLATDPATTRDIPNFCRHLGHVLVDNSQTENPNGSSDNHTDKLYRYVIQKK